MASTDIANNLHLVPEMVSRVLKRLQEDGIVAVERREVELLQGETPETMAAPILRQ